MARSCETTSRRSNQTASGRDARCERERNSPGHHQRGTAGCGLGDRAPGAAEYGYRRSLKVGRYTVQVGARLRQLKSIRDRVVVYCAHDTERGRDYEPFLHRNLDRAAAEHGAARKVAGRAQDPVALPAKFQTDGRSPAKPAGPRRGSVQQFDRRTDGNTDTPALLMRIDDG